MRGRKKKFDYVETISFRLTAEERRRLDMLFARFQIPAKVSINEKMRRLINAAYLSGARVSGVSTGAFRSFEEAKGL